MNETSLRQSIRILRMIDQKNLSSEDLDKLYKSGLLSDLLSADVSNVSRDKFRKSLGLSPLPRFKWVANFGIITVPHDYDQETQLAKFSLGKQSELCKVHRDINDTNFSNPSRILKPGEKFQVRVYGGCNSGSISSMDALAFLKEKKAILVGAQGLSLVFTKKSNKLRKGHGYVSFDDKEKLGKDSHGYVGVPMIRRDWEGYFSFCCGDFEEGFATDEFFILCFCEVDS